MYHFYLLFVFWLALWAHQNSAKYSAILHNKTSNKIYVHVGINIQYGNIIIIVNQRQLQLYMKVPM